MQRDNAVVEVSSGEDDTTESHTTTTEFLSDELKQAAAAAAVAEANETSPRSGLMTGEGRARRKERRGGD
jgi:hypothetical protein